MKHTATPKTWDVRKQGRGYEQRQTLTEGSRCSLCYQIAKKTGWGKDWLETLPQDQLFAMARKHL